jgi:ribosomal protein S30
LCLSGKNRTVTFKTINYVKQNYTWRGRNIYNYQLVAGNICQHQLAVVYRFCGCEPFTIIHHQMVFDGRHPEEVWGEIKPHFLLK